YHGVRLKGVDNQELQNLLLHPELRQTYEKEEPLMPADEIQQTEGIGTLPQEVKKPGIAYEKITLKGGKRFIIRKTGESEIFLNGIEVNKIGDEVVLKGATERLRIIDKSEIKLRTPMEMSKKYAELVPSEPQQISISEPLKEPKPSKKFETPEDISIPVTRKGIIDEISERLNLPIRKGHFVGRALAHFRPKEGIVEVKAGGIQSTAHEVGHYIQAYISGNPYTDTKDILGLKMFKDELLSIATK
ncbi:MAG: hypothetical protein AAB875_03135, partial [Patescibacteria group bacterium]